jgi:hypothetical protein
MITMPLQTARAYREIMRVTRNTATTTLSHRPTTIAAVQSDIQGAIIFRIGSATF